MTQLTKYKSKRDFKDTPEPTGKTSKTQKNSLIFTVQKHAASHLHYDFRLECDGVLKSWAVPKGPSLNPADKRLAIMVEDHPFDYWNFEGTIPKGNYGGGTVMVWDTGTYEEVSEPSSRKENEKLIHAGLEKGHITFVLHGKKLSGEFALVKMKNDSNQWLLIKKSDKYARKTPVVKQDRSVLTGRSMDEISHGVKKKEEFSLTHFLNGENAHKEKMPTNVHPMLGVLVEKPFDRLDWIFEIKWDGYRAIAQIHKKSTLLYSRNHKSFNTVYPKIVDQLSKLNLDAILDGEVVILDDNGKPQFQLLQNFQSSRKGEPVYYVFDILHLNGYNLRGLPLIKRKEILKSILASLTGTNVRFCDHIEKQGVAFFKKAAELNLEGIMAKDSSSSYIMKRSSNWQKIKTHLRQEVVIGGFTQPRGGREKFGALLVGVYDHKKLVYAGHVGGGFTQKLLNEVYAQLKPLITESSPFQSIIKPNAPVTWVKPKLVCEVSFAEWTSESIMRQPIFKGMRSDKNPKSISREQVW